MRQLKTYYFLYNLRTDDPPVENRRDLYQISPSGASYQR